MSWVDGSEYVYRLFSSSGWSSFKALLQIIGSFLPSDTVQNPRKLESWCVYTVVFILISAFTGFETQNKYTIKNSTGQKVYYAVEDSDCLTRNCCGPLRPFDMKILDNFKNEVIHLNRPLACDSCWFPCCLQASYTYYLKSTAVY